MINRIVKARVPNNQIEAFKAQFLEAKVTSEKEAGFIHADLFQDRNDPTLFFAHERLKDEAAAEFHNQQAHTQKLFGFLETAKVQVELIPLGETKPAAQERAKPAKTGEEPFVIFFIFQVKPDYRDRLIARFNTHITQTRNEPGNLLFDLYTVEGDDETLVVYEHWRKESDVWDIHMNQPYAVETGALMNEGVVGELAQYMSFVAEVH